MLLLLSTVLLRALVFGDAVTPGESQLAAAIAAEHEALRDLASRRDSLLGYLDALERRAHESEMAAKGIAAELAKIERQAGRATVEEVENQRAKRALEVTIAPLLVSLYRLERGLQTGSLLAPAALESELRKRKAIAALARSQAHRLNEVSLLERRGKFYAHRRALLADLGARNLAALQMKRAILDVRARDLERALEAVRHVRAHRAQLLDELTASEAELTERVADLRADEASTAFAARRGTLQLPTDGIIEAAFGKVVNPFFKTQTLQNGLDIRAPAGSPVWSVATGTVAHVGWLRGYGNLVILAHGERYFTLYAHLEDFAVEKGDVLSARRLLGHVGDTGSFKGAYLYFEIRRGGTPVDPRPWLVGEDP